MLIGVSMATLKDSLDFFDRLKIVSGVYGKKCIKEQFSVFGYHPPDIGFKRRQGNSEDIF